MNPGIPVRTASAGRLPNIDGVSAWPPPCRLPRQSTCLLIDGPSSAPLAATIEQNFDLGPLIRYFRHRNIGTSRRGRGGAHGRGAHEQLVDADQGDRWRRSRHPGAPGPGRRRCRQDPIAGIVGSLGIRAEIDFANQQVAEDPRARRWCSPATTSSWKKTPSIPRDARFITDRICGICGDDRCTTLRAQPGTWHQRARAAARRLRVQPGRTRGLHRPRDLQRLHVQHGFYDRWSRTNPTVLAQAEQTWSAARGTSTSCRTITDIMHTSTRSPAPFYLGVASSDRAYASMLLPVQRHHTHPSTACRTPCPASRTGAAADFYVRLITTCDYTAEHRGDLHDDLYDFWLQAPAGVRRLGRLPGRDLVCWARSTTRRRPSAVRHYDHRRPAS